MPSDLHIFYAFSPTLKTDAEISVTTEAQRAPSNNTAPPGEQPQGTQAPGPSVQGREATTGSWKPELAKAVRIPR